MSSVYVPGNDLSRQIGELKGTLFCNRLVCDENDQKVRKIKRLLEEATKEAKTMRDWSPER